MCVYFIYFDIELEFQLYFYQLSNAIVERKLNSKIYLFTFYDYLNIIFRMIYLIQ